MDSLNITNYQTMLLTFLGLISDVIDRYYIDKSHFSQLPTDILIDILTTNDLSFLLSDETPFWTRILEEYDVFTSDVVRNCYCEFDPYGLGTKRIDLTEVIRNPAVVRFDKLNIVYVTPPIQLPDTNKEEYWQFYERALKSKSLEYVHIQDMWDFPFQDQEKLLKLIEKNKKIRRVSLYPTVVTGLEVLYQDILSSGHIQSAALNASVFEEEFDVHFLEFLMQPQFVELILINTDDFFHFDAPWVEVIIDLWLNRASYPGHMQKFQFELHDDDVDDVIDLLLGKGGRRRQETTAGEEFFVIPILRSKDKQIEVRLKALHLEGSHWMSVDMVLSSGDASVTEEFDDYNRMRHCYH